MFRLFVLSGIGVASISFAQVPDPTITTLSSYNGYATVAGRLSSQVDGPVGISVQNGNLSYSTLTDSDGRWGIVIRHQSTHVTVKSWDLRNTNDQSREVKTEVSFEKHL